VELRPRRARSPSQSKSYPASLIRYLTKQKPLPIFSEGVSCFQSGLELVDEVQGQRDGIALVRRGGSSSSAVWLVAAGAMVPTEFSATDHVRPERVVGCESQSSQPVLQVAESIVAPIIERPVCAFGVIATDVKLPLLVCLEGRVTGDGIRPGVSCSVERKPGRCIDYAGAAEAIIKRGSHRQSFKRGL